MGYQAPTYKLVWPEGHRLHGLVIRMRGMTIEELGRLTSAQAVIAAAKSADESGDGEFAATQAVMEMFSRRLIEWNYLDEDDLPLGTSPEEIARADMGVVMMAIGAWQKEVTRVPDPLPETSSNGQRFQVPPVPMDLPSPNLSI